MSKKLPSSEETANKVFDDWTGLSYSSSLKLRELIAAAILGDRRAVLEAAVMAGRDAIDTAYGRNWTAKWQKGWKRTRHRDCFITAGEIFENAIRALKEDL